MWLPQYLGRMLIQAVVGAFANQPVEKRDAATAELALTYARLIDNAAPAAKYRKALAWLARIDSDDEKADEYAALIATALAEHTVASDLGPKLLAVMESLEMSPRARTAAKKGSAHDQPSANPLDQLAAARARKGRPADRDTAAP